MVKKEDRAGDMVREEAQAEAVRFEEMWESLRDRCESPIEELLVAALLCTSKAGEHDIHFMLTGTPKEPYFLGAAFVYLQAKIGDYRADICIVDATNSPLAEPRTMIVECDGHDFHERTKEQARRDKRRDRFFQSKGYKVLRFTGSEIWADPMGCANEVIEELAANDDWRNRAK